MLDVLVINPAGYRGTPRRGPYELQGFRAQCEAAGLTTDFLDLQAEVGAGNVPFPSGHVEAVAALLRTRPARCILVTMRTTAGPWVLEIARLGKEVHVSCLVIAYAPRIEERVQRMIARGITAIDLLVLASQELSVGSLIKDALASKPLEGVLAKPDGPLVDAAHSTSPSLFQISPPWVSPDRSIAAIQVGRGCPERCTFCAAHLGRGATPVYADAADIVSAAQHAFEQLDQRCRLFVMLETENLISAGDLIEQISALRSAAGATFLWGAYGRIDDVGPKMSLQLWRSGCRFLFFGIETASPKLLKVLGKVYDTNDVVPRLAALHKLGIKTQSSFIFGIPGETYDDFLTTAKLMAEVAWTGGFVDWTPLRIEAGSAMERLTSRLPKRILREGELYRDLSLAGISPEGVDADAAYRIFGVEMVDCDVDVACVLARKWRWLLTNAPLTAYVIHHGLGVTMRDFFSRMDGIELSDGCEAMWRDAPESAKEFLGRLNCYEIHLNVLPRHPTEGQVAQEFELIYDDLRSAPALLQVVFNLDWWSGASSACAGTATTRHFGL